MNLVDKTNVGRICSDFANRVLKGEAGNFARKYGLNVIRLEMSKKLEGQEVTYFYAYHNDDAEPWEEERIITEYNTDKQEINNDGF